MRIAVIARMLRRDKIEGIGMFAKETLSRIVKNHPEHEFVFLFDRNFDDEFVFEKNVQPLILSFPARHVIQMAYWHQIALKGFLEKNKFDLLISPDGNIPLQSSVPTLSVIHDLNFEHYPDDLPFFVRNYYRYYYPRIAKVATRIATVSQFSKSDIVNHYGIDEKKIDVVYNGVDDHFMPLTEDKIATIRNKYSGGGPYFLYVGSIHKRKNVDGMISAYNLFRNKVSSNIKFIFAGTKRWWNKEMEDAVNQSPFREDILFIGRVDDNHLAKLMASAFALVLASKFEGFGIPIVEAMKCGVPVITSDVTAMPEVAGDSALLVNPLSPESISTAMAKLSTDDLLRQSLIKKGFDRARMFTWDQSATQLWKSAEKTFSQQILFEHFGQS